jgi:hypothetical protein
MALEFLEEADVTLRIHPGVALRKIGGQVVAKHLPGFRLRAEHEARQNCKDSHGQRKKKGTPGFFPGIIAGRQVTPVGFEKAQELPS